MDDEQYGRYTVREAAIRLGLSEAAVRQRIRRHTLVAERSEGIVYVLLADDTPSQTPNNTASETVDTTPDSTAIMTAQQQLEVVRDTLLRPLIELTERQQVTIAEQAKSLGRLEAERDQARQSAEAAIADRDQLQEERDELVAVREALRGRLSALEAQQAESPVQVSSAPEMATRDASAVPWWQFWKR